MGNNQNKPNDPNHPQEIPTKEQPATPDPEKAPNTQPAEDNPINPNENT